MIIEADNSLNSLRNRRSKTAQAGLRPAYVFPFAISKGGAHAHAPPPTVRHCFWKVRSYILRILRSNYMVRPKDHI